MAKSQQRSSKEAKKPKQEKAKPPASVKHQPMAKGAKK